MNILRASFFLLLLSLALSGCNRDVSDPNKVSSKQSSDTMQEKADNAAQVITDATNQTNASIEAEGQVVASDDGKLFKADLLSVISRADRIIITEHSNKNDYSDPDAGVVYQGPVIKYGQVELNDKQKADFSSVIISLSNETQDAFAACIFDPHHTIQFYSGGKLSDTMEVCFQCGQVEWKGNTRTPPWSIYSGLSRVVKSVGLSPERDWRKLAIPRRNK